MTQKLDYSNEDAMKILQNQNYSEDDKRKLYQQYINNLKTNRKNAIVAKLNEYAKNIPVITKEIYISKLKEYELDDLSKPFEVVEKELLNFEADMNNKYNMYLRSQNVNNVQEPKEKVIEEETFDDTIFNEPILNLSNEVQEDIEEEVKPSLIITKNQSVINEDVSDDVLSLFNESNSSKEIIPEDTNETEKGSASAIIISIIAVIIGIVVMYSIIKFN